MAVGLAMAQGRPRWEGVRTLGATTKPLSWPRGYSSVLCGWMRVVDQRSEYLPHQLCPPTHMQPGRRE